jgi:hypothetical protein
MAVTTTAGATRRDHRAAMSGWTCGPKRTVGPGISMNLRRNTGDAIHFRLDGTSVRIQARNGGVSG